MSLQTPRKLSSASASASATAVGGSPFIGSTASTTYLTPLEISPDDALSSSQPSQPSPRYPQPHYQTQHEKKQQWQHLYVLPVLLMEFLALALTRAVLPSLLLAHYGDSVYVVMGMAECVRGLLAFVSCPLFGKVSDVIGRRLCLFVTVAGTCAPVCSLALLFGDWDGDSASAATAAAASEAGAMPYSGDNLTMAGLAISEPSAAEEDGSEPFPLLPETSSSSLSSNDAALREMHPHAITIFVVLLSLSGIFSSTFTIVFAYISDTVRERDERVSAYGLALATFGLSFTIGPMAGGYISQWGSADGSGGGSGKRYVFACSFVLTLLDLLYIYAVLPESRVIQEDNAREEDDEDGTRGGTSTLAGGLSILDDKMAWSPVETLRIVIVDPFLRKVGQVAFLYYTSLWAVISTLTLYAAKRFELGPERLGELMSALGLSTMIAEAVLVRIIVPILGEKRTMQLGIASFAMQCVVLGVAYEPWHLFVCAAFSLLGNLVYPSLSSLVSGGVEPEAVGEALGAINGIKALTEGVGPLVFGTLMTLSERSALPGWPYLLAALFAYAAYLNSRSLPDVRDDDYVHELDRKERAGRRRDGGGGGGSVLIERWMRPPTRPGEEEEEEEEYVSLLDGARDDGDDDGDGEILLSLSEIDESEDDAAGEKSSSDLTRLPTTFASFLGK